MEPACNELSGRAKRIPRQKWPGTFPADKGVQDDDHISVFEADLMVPSMSSEDHIAIWIDRYSPGYGPGWVVASVEVDNTPELSATVLGWTQYTQDNVSNWAISTFAAKQ
ncbi:hypothetical protein FRC17_005286 [Serendipita sp. 399]|nr:hypothetical protein FRC17_005286 [Serendipita sp. 399]